MRPLASILLLFALLVSGPTACKNKSTTKDSKPGPAQAPDKGIGPGLRLVYELAETEAVSADEQLTRLEQAKAVVQRRLDALEVGSAQVYVHNQQLVVEITGPNADSLENARRLMPRQGKLAFQLAVHESDFMRRLCDEVRSDSKAGPNEIEVVLDSWLGPDNLSVQDCYLSAPDRRAMLTADEARAEGCLPTEGEERSACLITGRQRMQRYLESLAKERGLHVDDDHELVFERLPPSPTEEARESYWRSYYVERAPILSGANIANAEVVENDLTGAPEVALSFDEAGTKSFAEDTASHRGYKLAIVYDDEVMSAPIIQEAIPGGKARIFMGMGSPDQLTQDASDLVLLLRAGALPAPLALASEVVIEAAKAPTHSEN